MEEVMKEIDAMVADDFEKEVMGMAVEYFARKASLSPSEVAEVEDRLNSLNTSMYRDKYNELNKEK